MKTVVIALGLGLGLSACQMQSEEDQLEEAIRNNLSAQGNVTAVELTRTDENNMTGFVDINQNNGRSGRLNCTAQRTTGTNFQWRCSPAITEQVVVEMEGNIRNELARQGEVVQVDLSRQDDNHMTGYAVVRDQMGNEIRTNCTATRDSTNVGTFNYQCSPGEQAAPAGEGGN